MYFSWSCQTVCRNVYLSNGCANIKRCRPCVSQSMWCVLTLLDGPFGHRTSYGGLRIFWPACLYLSTLNDKTLGSASAYHVKNTEFQFWPSSDWPCITIGKSGPGTRPNSMNNCVPPHSLLQWGYCGCALLKSKLKLIISLLRNICRKGVEVAVGQLRVEIKSSLLS